MKTKLLLCALLVFTVTQSQAQDWPYENDTPPEVSVNMQVPTGGLDAFYQPTHSGAQVGSEVENISLFDESGDFQSLHAIVEAHPERVTLLLPLILSCPPNRQYLEIVLNLMGQYGIDIQIVWIMTAEAHPIDMLSPYQPSGNMDIWIPQENQPDWLYEQIESYGDLLERTIEAKSRFQLNSYVSEQYFLLDQPGLPYLNDFFESPILILLIDQNKIVQHVEFSTCYGLPPQEQNEFCADIEATLIGHIDLLLMSVGIDDVGVQNQAFIQDGVAIRNFRVCNMIGQEVASFKQDEKVLLPVGFSVIRDDFGNTQIMYRP